MTGRASADCVLNDMSRTLQDHTGTDPYKRSMLSQQSDVCVCMGNLKSIS